LDRQENTPFKRAKSRQFILNNW